MPISTTARRVRGFTATRCANAISARMPPSPRLSARITRSTYLIVTIRISDQKIRERQPITSQFVAARGLKRSSVDLKA